MPGDDMAEVEARAAIARRDRPERVPFDKLDVNQLTDQILNRQGAAGISTPLTPDQETPEKEPAKAPLFNSAPVNPFEESEDPFAPSSPF